MRIKLLAGKRTPRLKVIPGLDTKKYRGLQSGKEENVDGKAADFLLQGGWVKEIKIKATKIKEKEVSE